MRRITGIGAVLGTAIAIGLITGLAQVARAADESSQAAYRDIEQTLGMVPAFFRAFPESGIAGAGRIQVSPAQFQNQPQR
jgi:hypothetical protein